MTAGLRLRRAMICAVSSTAFGVGRLVMMSLAACGARRQSATSYRRPRLLAPGGLDIAADHPPARRDQVPRKRPTHDAEADDADCFAHAVAFVAANAKIAIQGRSAISLRRLQAPPKAVMQRIGSIPA
jgi:hypothetical protein